MKEKYLYFLTTKLFAKKLVAYMSVRFIICSSIFLSCEVQIMFHNTKQVPTPLFEYSWPTITRTFKGTKKGWVDGSSSYQGMGFLHTSLTTYILTRQGRTERFVWQNIKKLKTLHNYMLPHILKLVSKYIQCYGVRFVSLRFGNWGSSYRG